MNIGKWLFTGLPLVALGAIWLDAGITYMNKQPAVALTLGTACPYLIIGFLALSENRWCRKLARIAWYPLLLVFPIGTLYGIFALKSLRSDSREVKRFRESIKINPLSLEDSVAIVSREARSRLRLKENQFDQSLVGSLKFGPAEVISFIDDLESDYGFDINSFVTINKASVLDIINAIARSTQQESNKSVLPTGMNSTTSTPSHLNCPAAD